MHFSYSQLTSFSQCGERYRLEKIEKIPQTPSVWSIAGSTIHQVTEDLDKYWIMGVTPPPVDELIEKYWDENYKRETLDIPDELLTLRQSRNEGIEWWQEQMPKHIKNWTDWRDESGWIIWADGDNLGIELPVKAMVGEKHETVGYIDRVMVTPEGQVVVLDLKSGRNAPKAPLQLGIYSILMGLDYGITPPLGAYFHTRTVVPRAKKDPTRHGTLIGPYDLDGFTPKLLERMVSSLAKAREHDVYMPNVSNLCPSCSVNTECYAFQATEPPPLTFIGGTP